MKSEHRKTRDKLRPNDTGIRQIQGKEGRKAIGRNCSINEVKPYKTSERSRMLSATHLIDLH